MNIVYDHHIFATYRDGGIARYFVEIASEIAKENRVTIAAPLYRNRYLHLRPDLVRGRYFNFGQVGGSIADFVGTHFGSIGTGRPDIVHETYYYGEPTHPSAQKRVTTVHDMINELFYPERAVVGHKRRSVERADLVLCVSQRTKEDLLNTIPISEDRIRVVYNGFELRTSPAAQRSLPRLPSYPYFLHVGRRGIYKNFGAVIDAIARSQHLSRDFGIVCFGGGPFSMRERQAIRASGINTDRICQVSGSDDLLSDYYAHAVAYVCSSLYEGFGIPALEAMSFDCPVCCSSAGALPEIVGDAALLFEPKNIDQLTGSLEQLAGDSARRLTLIGLGRERAKKYGWAKCASETMAAYYCI
jgi:glycosyltransferase involved in cell wall biosynthesis